LARSANSWDEARSIDADCQLFWTKATAFAFLRRRIFVKDDRSGWMYSRSTAISLLVFLFGAKIKKIENLPL